MSGAASAEGVLVAVRNVHKEFRRGSERIDVLQGLNREHGKTIVMVTHDPHAAKRATRVLYLDKGVLVKEPVA